MHCTICFRAFLKIHQIGAISVYLDTSHPSDWFKTATRIKLSSWAQLDSIDWSTNQLGVSSAHMTEFSSYLPQCSHLWHHRNRLNSARHSE